MSKIKVISKATTNNKSTAWPLAPDGIPFLLSLEMNGSSSMVCLPYRRRPVRPQSPSRGSGTAAAAGLATKALSQGKLVPPDTAEGLCALVSWAFPHPDVCLGVSVPAERSWPCLSLHRSSFLCSFPSQLPLSPHLKPPPGSLS